MKRFLVVKTSEFDAWLKSLPPKTQRLVVSRLDFLSTGYLGDHKKFDGLIELRWKNGMRIYAFIWNAAIYVVLNGGNKNGQSRDIRQAKKIRKEIVENS